MGPKSEQTEPKIVFDWTPCGTMNSPCTSAPVWLSPLRQKWWKMETTGCFSFFFFLPLECLSSKHFPKSSQGSTVILGYFLSSITKSTPCLILGITILLLEFKKPHVDQLINTYNIYKKDKLNIPELPDRMSFTLFYIIILLFKDCDWKGPPFKMKEFIEMTCTYISRFYSFDYIYIYV